MKTPKHNTTVRLWRDPDYQVYTVKKPAVKRCERWLAIQLTAESLAELRETIKENVWQAMKHDWALDHYTDRILKSLGLPVRPSGKKKESGR